MLYALIALIMLAVLLPAWVAFEADFWDGYWKKIHEFGGMEAVKKRLSGN